MDTIDTNIAATTRPIADTRTAKRLLRLPKVIESTGLSRSSIYRKIEAADFPRPVRLGPKSVAWIEGEVQQWMEQLELSRDREWAT